MKVAFAVCSLGLGHASRSLPLINALIKEGNEVTVIAHGRSKNYIEKSLENINIIDLPDYPLEYTKTRASFFPNIILKSPAIVSSFIEEHKEFLNLQKKHNFDLIISDNRYGIFDPNVPSYIITHQLRIMNPFRIRTLETLSMVYNNYVSKFFRKIFVPDFEDNSLSGNLSHEIKFIEKNKIKYIGPLSNFRKLDMPKDIDILFTISGPEPQRTIFEEIILREIKKFDGKYYIVLGRPDKNKNDGNIISFASHEEMEKLYNRAKIIISRSGYSTIMDIFYIGGKAFFIPTPSQPEQEYLAEYLYNKNVSGYSKQEEFELNLITTENFTGFDGGYNKEDSVKKFMDEVM
ncbi:MAG: glycosyltransferase family protein [Thermoplasmata archaeon]